MRQKFARISKSRTALVGAGAVALAAVIGTTVGYASMGKDVTLNVDGHVEHVTASGDTVGQVLKDQGISLRSHDEVAPAVDEPVHDGTSIAVRYGKPLKLDVDGDTSTYWVTATNVRSALQEIDRSFDRAHLSVSRGAGITRDGLRISIATPKRLTFVIGGHRAVHKTVPASTVGQALKALDVKVGTHDAVHPGLRHELSAGDSVVLDRIRIVRKHLSAEAVPFSTVTRDDSSMTQGQSTVVRSGRAGLRSVTYRITFRNGRLVVRKVLAAAGAARPGRPDRAGRHQDRRHDELRRWQHGLGPARSVRVRRQLGHEHRERLLRRSSVLARHLAGVRWKWTSQQCFAGDPDRDRDQDPQRQRRVRRLAGLRGLAGASAVTRPAWSRWPVAPGSEPPRTPIPAPRSPTGQPDSPHRLATMTSAGPTLLGPADVRALAARLGVRPTKQRGQNFVIDANTVRRIVREAGLRPDDVVVEVGPGLGSLTLALLGEVAHVVAIEVDPVLAAALPETLTAYAPELAARCDVLAADALRIDAVPGPPPTALVANLPYNVSVPVLLHLLALLPTLEKGLVMVQSEVADRLAAGPGSKVYGVPSVKAAWYADVRRAGAIGRNVFWPAPNVDSGLVAWTPAGAAATTATGQQVFAVVDAAFAHRRKALRGALRDLAGSSEAAAGGPGRAGIDPLARGESLTVQEFARLAEALP